MDNWAHLRQLTQARIALGSAGSALPTAALTQFQIAHAEARDAVLQDWAVNTFMERLQLPAILLSTQVSDRRRYLQRPDLGRRLSDASRQTLGTLGETRRDVALILSNGLSTPAIEAHARMVLSHLLQGLREAKLTSTSLFLVPNGRVALSDEIGALTEARSAILLIGERPGLSAADSLGIYLTLFPSLGKTDADRNCISNVREPDGLDYSGAAAKTLYLLQKGFALGIGGVALKDDSPEGILPTQQPPPNQLRPEPFELP